MRDVTQIFDLDDTAIFQAKAVDSLALLIGHKGTIFLGDAKAVDVELGFGGDAVVKVARAALHVDARFLGQLGNSLACGTGELDQCLGMGVEMYLWA